jgi:hypothetical protein
MIRKFETPDGRPVVYTHYDSIAEMEHALVGAHNYSRAENAGQAARVDGRERMGFEWYGVDGLPEVKRILREGYPEGAALVDRLYERAQPTLPRALDFRRKLVRSDQGDSLDIHAVNRGALDRAWSTVKRRAALGTGLIRIVVDICGNADMSAEQLKWRGLAALALSRAMTKAGYSVEIVAGQAGGGGFNRRKEIGVVTTTIKPRYANVDTATLASAVVMTGFFRFLGFLAIIKQADECGWDVNSGLGHDVSLHTVMPPAEKIAQVVTPKINDETAALAWVADTVRFLQSAATLSQEAA